ncbi:MAG TPA: sigma-70 family RNA polymerase sigma factor [Ktedonobacteraceae bacterium]|nr:sigma-70 family RNA polymerase sigma factor [Ktedonobacteraceae bacterium]
MDMQEFQRFYQEKVGLIYRYVYNKVGNREDAEDLTSGIFLKAVSALNQEFSQQSMHKWLFLIARTTVATYWRAHYRGPGISLDELLEAGWEGPTEEEPAAISSEQADRVQHLLQALPEQYREVLTCRFLLNLSIKNTALRMGLTEANVKVLQFRGLKRAANLEQVVAEHRHGAL